MDEIRKLKCNMKCFDCHEKVILSFSYLKGTTYVVMDFGVFICSACSTYHREMNHKVKGIAMCNFSDKETQFLQENGNDVFYLCAYYKQNVYE